MAPLICPLSQPNAPFFLNFFDFTYAPSLMFYAYIPIILLSIILPIILLVKDRHSLQSKLFFGLSLSFAIWIANVILQWTVASADIVMFSWEVTPLIEVFMSVLVFYFVFTFIYKKDLPFYLKTFFSALILLTALSLPSNFNIPLFDIENCQAIVGPLIYLVYGLEILISLLILILTVYEFYRNKIKGLRSPILFLGIGAALFLGIFSLSNIFGEVFQTYEINLVGPVGMVIFIGLLTYSIVKFRTFNIKLLGTQALVATLWILIGSILFVAVSPYTRVITAATEILAIIFGIILIKSVKKEVAQREQIEKLAGELRKANTKLEKANDDLTAANVKLKDLDRQKTEFLSIASHQLRAPITAIKGYASMMLEGSFGVLADQAKGAADVIYQSCQRLALVIEDFLDITRIELGRMKYAFAPLDLRELVDGVVKQMLPIATSHNLKLEFKSTLTQAPLTADVGKLTQVINNLLDNSIKYTPQGAITVSLEQTKKKSYQIILQDTGVGMDKTTLNRLFQKFSRAEDANKTNATGTGLGLYVAKQLAEAHGGSLRAESDGPGKGSRFIVELPVKR